MEQLNITWFTGLKVWWSYTWRAVVLTLLVTIPLALIAMGIMMAVDPPRLTMEVYSKALDPQTSQMTILGKILLRVAVIAVIVTVHAFAMRWMLRKAK